MARASTIIDPIQRTFTEVLAAAAPKVDESPISQGRPFLKWVGGKRSILPELISRLPNQYDRYCEPFLGGGALFFAVSPENAYLSDINLHLVLAYLAVQKTPLELIEQLNIHAERHSKSYFKTARRLIGIEQDRTKIAALMIYLNKTCFNGLYRVNKKGEFNVPIGSYKDPGIFDRQVILNDSAALRGATIQQHSFTQIPIHSNHFYYLDPPYHKTYSSYDGSGFGETEHKRLAELCRRIDSTGGMFMLSNSATDFIKRLYKGFKCEDVSAARSISCKGSQRGRETELLIRNY